MSAIAGNSSAAFVGPVAPATVRAPRAAVWLNGALMQGLVGITIGTNNNFEAARFTIDANIQTTYAMNAAFWSNQTRVTAVIMIGYQSGASVAWQTVLTGLVDDYEIGLDGRELTLNGRDLAAQLIDTKTAENYANQTSSEIATLLANSVGLTPVVRQTTTPVGRY
jgi:hypothetical protein